MERFRVLRLPRQAREHAEMSLRLLDKVCVITGTGGCMGREAARTFTREGASVVGCDLNVDAAQATVDAVRAEEGKMVSLQPCRLTIHPTVRR